jgi:hypothetical protein
MKSVVAITVAMTVMFSSLASQLTIEDISPHFATNMPIVWQASMDRLPNSFWTYKTSPQNFSFVAISNAIVLAGLQNKGFPNSSTNQLTIWADHSEVEPEPPYLLVLPNVGQLSFTLGDRTPEKPSELPKNEAVEQAWKYLLQFEVDRNQLRKTNVNDITDLGVALPRLVDGVEFQKYGQGFSLLISKDGKLLNFSLLWPKLERVKNEQIASRDQITACIRAFKTPSPPIGEEQNYFDWLKQLAKARKLIVNQIKPYYGEGIYGEVFKENEISKPVVPYAELEALADFGDTNFTVKLLAPIISSEATRLLKQSH